MKKLWRWAKRDKIIAFYIAGIGIMLVVIGLALFLLFSGTGAPAVSTTPFTPTPGTTAQTPFPETKPATPPPGTITPSLLQANQGRDQAPPPPPDLLVNQTVNGEPVSPTP